MLSAEVGLSQEKFHEPFYLGAVTDLGWRATATDITDKLLKDIGFNSYRTEMYWHKLEQARGAYSFTSAKYGYNILDRYILDRAQLLPSQSFPAPLMLLDYGNPTIYAGNFNYGSAFPPDEKFVQGFVSYARAVASRYKEKIPLFEVWNEWNGGMGSGARDANTSTYALAFGGVPCSPKWSKKYCWTQAAAGGKDANGRYRNQSATMPEYYLRLFKPVREAIKAVAPKAKVIAGVTAGLDWEWTYRFVQAGGWKYVKDDGFAVHPYIDGTSGLKSEPEDAIGQLDLYQESFRRWVHEKETIPFNKVKDIPIYITEIGYSTFNGGDYHGKSGHARAASDMIKYLLMARSRPYIKGIWIYQIRDRDPVVLGEDGYEISIDSSDRERSFGLYYYDNLFAVPKQSAMVVKNWKIAEHLIYGRDFVCRSDGRPCRRLDRDSKHKLYAVLGNDYEVSWKDDKGDIHVARWKKGKLGIILDGKIIVR
jgi:hypothetical protein